MERENLTGTEEWVLITGASGGIGEAFARIFAREGYGLILVARNMSKLEALAGELSARYGIRTCFSARDFSREGEAEALYSEIREKKMTVHVLVNNAGFGTYGEFSGIRWEKLRDMIAVNITALTCLTRLFLPSMIERGYGRVLNVASTAAFLPGPLMAVYYATKSYVLRFTEALAEENRKTGVTFTALCPGPTLTGFDTAAGLSGSRLSRGFLVATAENVAEYGYKAMMKGRIVAIDGILNRILSFSVRFMPVKVLVRLSRLVQEAKAD